MRRVFVVTALREKKKTASQPGHTAVETRRATFNGSVFLRRATTDLFSFLILSALLKEPDDTQFVFIQFSALFYVGQFNLRELIKGAEGKSL